MQRLDAWFRGDRDALSELVDEHAAWMRRRAGREMHAEDRRALESIDVVQEALARLLRRGPAYAPRSRAEFRALLGQVLRATVLDERDRRRAVKRGGDKVTPLPSRGVSRIVVDGRTPTLPVDAVARNERAERVEEALQELPDADADVVRLRQVEGRTFDEVAAALDLESADAARMRYHRALPKLARHLASLDPTAQEPSSNDPDSNDPASEDTGEHGAPPT
ncbi:MAG: sigma-70 family RNA polymerase sigma factor [Planctomycetota bacterium]